MSSGNMSMSASHPPHRSPQAKQHDPDEHYDHGEHADEAARVVVHFAFAFPKNFRNASATAEHIVWPVPLRCRRSRSASSTRTRIVV